MRPARNVLVPSATTAELSSKWNDSPHVCCTWNLPGYSGAMGIKEVLYLIAAILCGLAAFGVGGRIALGWAGVGLAIFTFGVLD